MREVAFHINDEKRKVDNVKKIAEWQLSVEQWEVMIPPQRKRKSKEYNRKSVSQSNLLHPHQRGFNYFIYKERKMQNPEEE